MNRQIEIIQKATDRARIYTQFAQQFLIISIITFNNYTSPIVRMFLN